jgi:hypothetical protein
MTPEPQKVEKDIKGLLEKVEAFKRHQMLYRDQPYQSPTRILQPVKKQQLPIFSPLDAQLRVQGVSTECSFRSSYLR